MNRKALLIIGLFFTESCLFLIPGGNGIVRLPGINGPHKPI